MNFAKWVFRIAAVYGLLVIIPLYFTERRFGLEHPPAITHPEFYYGFAGLVVVWQIVFLLVASDVRRYRPLMLVAIGEKMAFFLPAVILYAAGRLDATMLAAGCVDAILAVLFATAWWMSASRGPAI